jgi:6-hydroxymethylpterin diphosphokinase MptE-like
MFFLKKEEVLYKENLELKNRFNHYRQCYILGTGPSINKLNLKFNENDLIISMGNFHEHPEINKIKPHIHVFAASHDPITDEVLKKWWHRAEEKLPKNTLILVENRDYALAKKCFKSRDVFKYSYGGKFPIDFTKKLKSPESVSQIAMQLAIYIKFSKIYFLGINLHWQLLDSYSHFYSHNQPSLEFYLKEEGITVNYDRGKDLSKEVLYRLYKIYQSYELINYEAQKYNLCIINGDEFSKFDVFPYENFA